MSGRLQAGPHGRVSAPPEKQLLISYTLVCCHFGDPFWITHALTQVDALSDERIASIVIVDQSRKSEAMLKTLPRVTEVLTFPIDAEQVRGLGHDHPAALNRAMASVDFETSHIMVLDSDCFPLDDSWLDRLKDVTLAGDPAKAGLSHPCLMTFPTAMASIVDFTEGLQVGIDTGRLVALQIAKAGLPVFLDQPLKQKGFGARHGHYYLQGSVYHHGLASFISAQNIRLTRQVSPHWEMIYQRRIAAGHFDLSVADRILFLFHQLVKRLRGSA